MSKQKAGRTEWLDETTDAPMIGQYAERLGTFLETMADGRIDPGELKAQEGRVAKLMKSVEPKLDDALHDEVTRLLCEVSALSIMETVHRLLESTPKSKFRG